MHTRHVQTRAFTFVEVMIVVSILAILAAIVAPRFLNVQEQASENAAAMTMVQIRSGLERFKIDHERYPSLNELWHVLISPTNKDGQLDDDGRYGPYLTEPPINPWTYVPRVVAEEQNDDEAGFRYNAETGEVKMVGFNETTKTYTGPRFIKAVQLNKYQQQLRNESVGSSVGMQVNMD